VQKLGARNGRLDTAEVLETGSRRRPGERRRLQRVRASRCPMRPMRRLDLRFPAWLHTRASELALVEPAAADPWGS